jgi:hypothetical protein
VIPCQFFSDLLQGKTGLCRMRTESVAVALTAGRETDFGRQRLGCQNRRYRDLKPAAETARQVFEARKRPQIAGYSSETEKGRFALECVVVLRGL